MSLTLEEAREYLVGEKISDEELERLMMQLEVLIKHLYQSEIERYCNEAN